MARGVIGDAARSVVLLWAAAAGPVAAQGASSFDEKALHGHWVSVGGCETQPGPGGADFSFVANTGSSPAGPGGWFGRSMAMGPARAPC